MDREDGPVAMVARLCAATTAHDLDALVDCFAPDYRNETPAHPARGFAGSEQVARNWQQIFDAVPDLTAQVLGCAVDGDTVWSEWEMRGTRRDGAAHLMRGVIVFGVVAGRAAWARLYLEPVHHGGGGVEEAVRATVGIPASSPGVSGHAQHVHVAVADLECEQDVEPPQGERAVDVEEVDREPAGGLRAQELPPAGSGPG